MKMLLVSVSGLRAYVARWRVVFPVSLWRASKFNNFRKSSQKLANLSGDKLFSKISLKYLGSGSFVESYAQKFPKQYYFNVVGVNWALYKGTLLYHH